MISVLTAKVIYYAAALTSCKLLPVLMAVVLMMTLVWNDLRYFTQIIGTVVTHRLGRK